VRFNFRRFALPLSVEAGACPRRWLGGRVGLSAQTPRATTRRARLLAPTGADIGEIASACTSGILFSVSWVVNSTARRRWAR
jgi:hypothetical protein